MHASDQCSIEHPNRLRPPNHIRYACVNEHANDSVSTEPLSPIPCAGLQRRGVEGARRVELTSSWVVPPPSTSLRRKAAARAALPGRRPGGGEWVGVRIGLYKIVFCFWAFVYESILIFANIPPFGHLTPRLHRPLYCAIYIRSPRPPCTAIYIYNIGKGNILSRPI